MNDISTLISVRQKKTNLSKFEKNVFFLYAVKG